MDKGSGAANGRLCRLFLYSNVAEQEKNLVSFREKKQKGKWWNLKEFCLWECMMRRKIAVICGAVLLAVVLLSGCSSVASGDRADGGCS